MKKKKIKKLKRRIRYLEERVDNQGTALLKMVPDIQKTKEKINKIDTLESEFETEKARIKVLENRVDVLNKRTTTDYTQFSKISCDSCDYPGMSGCGTQCAECPANDKKEKNNGD